MVIYVLPPFLKWIFLRSSLPREVIFLLILLFRTLPQSESLTERNPGKTACSQAMNTNFRMPISLWEIQLRITITGASNFSSWHLLVWVSLSLQVARHILFCFFLLAFVQAPRDKVGTCKSRKNRNCYLIKHQQTFQASGSVLLLPFLILRAHSKCKMESFLFSKWC